MPELQLAHRKLRVLTGWKAHEGHRLEPSTRVPMTSPPFPDAEYLRGKRTTVFLVTLLMTPLGGRISQMSP